jgi:predicted transcriptional regulator YdeE
MYLAFIRNRLEPGFELKNEIKGEMTMAKNYEIVSLPETYVAGLAFRTKNELEKDPSTGWIAKTWARLREMKNPNPPAAIYTDYESDWKGYFTVVAGFTRHSANDFAPGEVLAKAPAGRYAKFVNTGKLPEVVIEAWMAVWQAEKDGSLKRAYTTDLEIYPAMGKAGMNPDKITVELYIAIK